MNSPKTRLHEPTEFDAGLESVQHRQVPFGEMRHEDLVANCESLQRQLQIANLNLVERSDEFQEFVETISHDLGAPLRAIRGFSEFLLEDYEEQLDEEGRNYIGHIVDGVQRMRQRIRGLATLAKVKTQKSNFQLMDLNEVIDDVLDSLDESISRMGAIVSVESMPMITGDRLQLTQLLKNLIDNSLKFSGHDAPRVNVSIAQNETELTISVSDNGIGIESENNESVFKVFHRIDSPATNLGTGVGLTVCRRIAERHRGRIWLESNIGEGTTVHFSFPNKSPKHTLKRPRMTLGRSSSGVPS